MNPKQAPKWKLMLLTWLFIYPVINITFFLLFSAHERMASVAKNTYAHTHFGTFNGRFFAKMARSV